MKIKRIKFYSLFIVMILVGANYLCSTVNAEKLDLDRKIIADNNHRVQILDASQSPYQTACFLYINNAKQGSGVVVGKNTILTNRHVVASMANGNPENIKVNVARTSKTEFKGTFTGKEVKYSPDGQDLAIVYLNPNSNGKNIGDIVSPAKYIKNPETIPGTPIKVIGYPADKKWATLWESTGISTTQTTNRIYYNASTSGGNSGSGVFNNNNDLIGIHFGSAGEDNAAIRFKSSVYDFIRKNVESEKIDLIGIGVQGKGEFARVSLKVEKDKTATISRYSKYAFNPYFGNETYASIKIRNSKEDVLFSESWTGNQGVANYNKTTIQLDENSTIEIFHAEGNSHRYSTSNDLELKSVKAKKYVYKLVNNNLILLETNN